MCKQLRGLQRNKRQKSAERPPKTRGAKGQDARQREGQVLTRKEEELDRTRDSQHRKADGG